jgi:hypothetical protein
MLSAFLWWLGEGRDQIALPVSYEQDLVLTLPPVSFACPVQVVHEGEPPPDEDDPDVDTDSWDEEDSQESTVFPGAAT